MTLYLMVNWMNSKEQYTNKVKEYILIEYNREILNKMYDKKFSDICSGYIANCYSLNKTVPYTANGLVSILKKTK